jgi:hypothetical protein
VDKAEVAARLRSDLASRKVADALLGAGDARRQARKIDPCPGWRRA